VNEARDATYTAIEQALADQPFMILFEPSIVRSRFEESIQENLIIVPSESAIPDEEAKKAKTSSSVVKVAIAISSVAFVVASIFSYGFIRRQSQLNARQQATIARHQQDHRRKAARRGRRYFAPLESDDGTGTHSGPLIHLAKRYDEEGRSGVWSVSDMTSDSGSVQSILSKISSRLEKIEEEPNSKDDDDDRADIEASIQRELAIQTEMDDDDVALSSHYTAAYAAHKGRLCAIVKNALFDSDLEDEIDERDEEKERITPKTEESKSSSFDSPDDSSMCVSLAPPSLAEDLSDVSTVGHYHTPESAKTSGGMISVLTMEEFPEVYQPSGQPEKFLPEAYQLNDQSSFLLGLDLDLSNVSSDSDASLQRWLSRLLHELQASKDIKRIEL
jgi:type II secretory pathway pseudopilin PulG